MTNALQKGRRATQRQRLLAGMLIAANRDGYARANVTNVIAQAGVSRPTFYEYFADKDDCFLAALDDVQRRLLERIEAAVQDEPPPQAVSAAVRVLVAFAGSDPDMARFLCNEAMAGGPAALDARDAGIAAVERVIELRYEHLDRDASLPDFSARMLLGGVHRMLASRLHRGEPKLSELLDGLLGWVQSYERPAGESRWRKLQAASTPPRSPFLPATPLAPPDPLPRGRPRLSEQQVAENQRQRIMFAAAQIAEEKGYAATTVGEITRVAGVDGRAFYSMFADKHDVFMAVHEFGFGHVMEVTAAAFFSGETWLQRNWEAGRAFTQFLEQNPIVGHVGFVEAYAVGPMAAQRLEDSQAAFSMLLQEGYQHLADDARPSRVALEAIIATIFEIVYDRARGSEAPRLSELLAHFTFLVLSPFIGPEQANAFIDQKIDRRR
jgi:AcrR family transcriptional regulator